MGLFPSPYRGYHLSTIFSFIGNVIKEVFVSVPLSGLSSFNGEIPLAQRFGVKVSVPLSGLSSFNTVNISILPSLANFKFPSPYRGYHLSTDRFEEIINYFINKSFRPLIGVIIFQPEFTIAGGLKPTIGFRPLIGVIIFQLKLRKYLKCLSRFPSPYRGYHLSTFQYENYENYYNICFRPLIGVIIFQHYLNLVSN